jgi:hypothetical protein
MLLALPISSMGVGREVSKLGIFSNWIFLDREIKTEEKSKHTKYK